MNFLEFSDKIYNHYNKASQKCLEFVDNFGQVKQEKKGFQNVKKIKKKIVIDGIQEECWISNVYIFQKKFP